MSNNGWSEELLQQTTVEGERGTVANGIGFGAQLKAGDVVALFGPLGAGKTTFVKGVATALLAAYENEVSSPTFTYLHIYDRGQLPLYHFDLYRLSGSSDFLALGFEEFLESGGICCIEWSERIDSLLPLSHYVISLDHLSPERRLLTLSRRYRISS